MELEELLEVVESELFSEVELGNLSKVNQAQSGVKRKPDGNKVGMLDGMELREDLGSMERRLVFSLVSDSTLYDRGHDSWAIPKFSSSLRDLLDAGDVALDFLLSKARPCIVLVTDCRSVSCEEIVDLFNYEERIDVPIHVLDLSSPSWHLPRQSEPPRRIQLHCYSIYEIVEYVWCGVVCVASIVKCGKRQACSHWAR